MEEVRLREGSNVEIRPIAPEDKPVLAAGFEALSPESRYLRFLGTKKRLTTSDLAFLTEVDHTDHEALLAIEPGSGEGVGVARYVRDPDDRGAAEAAVTVVDAWQGRGLGTELLRRLVVRAREEGVERFTAELFTDNRDMLDLFRSTGEVTVTDRFGPTEAISVTLPVEEEALMPGLRAAARGEVSSPAAGR
jgi:RimJ/RimL family protein N-acetyltransferase